jgi:hypothetical protein
VINWADPNGEYPILPGNNCDPLEDLSEGPICKFPNNPEFSVFDNSVTNIITAAAMGEGRFASSEGLALQVAAFINALRDGNNIFGHFRDNFKTTSQEVCGKKDNIATVFRGCADSYINGLLSGNNEKEPNPPPSAQYPQGSAGLARLAFIHTKLQLLGHCGMGKGAQYYSLVGALLGIKPQSVTILEFIHSNPDMSIALTFHADWYDEMDDLECCVQTDYDRKFKLRATNQWC